MPGKIHTVSMYTCMYILYCAYIHSLSYVTVTITVTGVGIPDEIGKRLHSQHH